MIEVRSEEPPIRFKRSQVMEHLRRHHPNCPAKTMKLFAYRTSVQSWRGVSLGRAVGIVIDGFLRHERTEYERLLLEGVDRKEARRLVKPKMAKILRSWAVPPEDKPPPEQMVRMIFSAPEDGLIDLKITSRSAQIVWPLSHASDPFRSQFIEWLEAIVEGKSPTLALDLKQGHGVCRLTPCGPRQILAVFEGTGRRELPLAIQVKRTAFVSGLYSDIVEFWEGEMLLTNWHEWLIGLNRHLRQSPSHQPWSVRSPLIEDYLSRLPS